MRRSKWRWGVGVCLNVGFENQPNNIWQILEDFMLWFFPVCITHHWWVYAFDVSRKRLFVLDSIPNRPHDTFWSRLDAYAARLIEDMAQVAIPTYKPTQQGMPCTYTSVPVQPNGFDCGVYAINFMEYWTEGRNLNDWDYMRLLNFDFHMQDTIKLYRLEIMLDIILCHKNSVIGNALNAVGSLDRPPVRHNQPRNKRKEVRTPFTAPGTKSMLRRAAGMQKKKDEQKKINMERKRLYITFLFT
ncbi:ubiquitin-like-specific protease [Arachis hypogaea]|uniref:Ubiquitin-like-specific protease n=1 Tax=Arachis hypogaea TaxID=3818 RepID=A0A6B9VG77_ARAHY|nr:ubiquitin-like-specific protease [Arachis hypogaea]